MQKLAALLALGLSSAALAGAMAEVAQVYFSPDGRTVLAVTVSQSDAAEEDVHELHLLDTSTGRELWTRVGRLAEQWPALQKKYGFRQVSAPRYRRPLPALAPSEVGPWAVRAGQTQTTPVRLWTKAAPLYLRAQPLPRPVASCRAWGVQPASYALAVNGQALGQGQPQPCAYAYALARVDVQGNRALITLNAFTPMTGGPDFNLIFVAATLK